MRFQTLTIVREVRVKDYTTNGVKHIPMIKIPLNPRWFKRHDSVRIIVEHTKSKSRNSRGGGSRG